MTGLTSRERGKKLVAKLVCTNHGRPKGTMPIKHDCKSSAQVVPKVDRLKETECLIGGESSNEDWIHCKFCTNCDHENCSDTEGNPLFI